MRHFFCFYCDHFSLAQKYDEADGVGLRLAHGTAGKTKWHESERFLCFLRILTRTGRPSTVASCTSSLARLLGARAPMRSFMKLHEVSLKFHGKFQVVKLRSQGPALFSFRFASGQGPGPATCMASTDRRRSSP